MIAYCGLVGHPHLAAKIEFVAPLPTSTKINGCRCLLILYMVPGEKTKTKQPMGCSVTASRSSS